MQGKNLKAMLGETKYFGVKKKIENGEVKKIKIVEISPNEGTDKPEFPTSAGQGWKWIKDNNIWGSTPITIETGTNYGKKQGVYWERKYPIYSNNYFQGMNNLDAGLIRIVGRYWHKDSTYVVKLKASLGTKEASVKLKVVKPKTIGAKKDKLIDVKGNEYNLDELIIKYAGLNGVPPQIIKGIIEKESGFTNAMRWEPFFEIRYNIHKKDKNGNFTYWAMTKSRYTIKSENDIGEPTIPTDHSKINNNKNLYPQKYWGYQGTIWDLFYKNCKEVNPSAENDLYPNSGVSKWPIRLRAKWKSEYLKYYNIKFNEIGEENDFLFVSEAEFEAISNFARENANNSTKNEFDDGILNDPAQTRISSSYGLMQVLYTSATAFLNYPKDYYTNTTSETAIHLPEYLNEKDISLKYGAEGISYYVDQEINYKKDKKNKNWTAGFERTFEIGLYGYNHGFYKNKNDRYTHKKYGYDVLKRAQKYLPGN